MNVENKETQMTHHCSSKPVDQWVVARRMHVAVDDRTMHVDIFSVMLGLGLVLKATLLLRLESHGSHTLLHDT